MSSLSVAGGLFEEVEVGAVDAAGGIVKSGLALVREPEIAVHGEVKVVDALEALVELRRAQPRAARQLVDPDAGRAFAQRLCADCHVIGDRSTGRAPEGAPSFPSIATGSTTTELGLRTFLEKPHRGMPNLALTRREIEAVADYILANFVGK